MAENGSGVGIHPTPLVGLRVKFAIISSHCSLRMHAASVIRQDSVKDIKTFIRQLPKYEK